ncbi:MAG: TIGR00268 family protein, partial [Desulfitobacteriaceae bacterium]
MIVHDKLNALKTRIEELGSLAIGFSGGVDSTFLLKVAYDVLKDKVLAVIAKSSTYP